MDLQTYVTFLRLHGEHLHTVAGQLTGALHQLEHALTEQPVPTEADVSALVEGLAALSLTVWQTAEILHQRIRAFGEKTREEKQDSTHSAGPVRALPPPCARAVRRSGVSVCAGA